MDIFAHSVWAAIAAKKYNVAGEKRNTPKISIGWSAFWSVFPDLFAFGVPFVMLAVAIISGKIPFPGFHNLCPCLLNGPGISSWIPTFIPHAYQISHSLVTFVVVFGIVWLVRRRPPIVLFGWMLHILIDIFSHAATFYPTPFLWPISNFKYLHGVAWSNPWFMIINYVLLLVVFSVVFLKKRKSNPTLPE